MSADPKDPTADPPPGVAPATAGGPIRLNARIELRPDTPLPQLDGIAGTAIAARRIEGDKGEVFARVLSGRVPPRHESVTTLASIDQPAVMRMVDHGTIDWPADGGRRQVVVLDRPGGGAVMPPLAELGSAGAGAAWPEDRIIREVVRPLVPAFAELARRDFHHGGVRPDNIFHAGDAGVMLGECVTTPPGIGQPVVFEPIERGMAEPAGRGVGTTLDDLYAFGVTLLVLGLGIDPTAGASADQVLDAKIDRGSFPALSGTHKIPTGLIEPIRGLLVDDPRQRWTVAQLELWLNGRRLSPKMTVPARRAQRVFAYEGVEAWSCRMLGRVIAAQPNRLLPALDAGEVERWIKVTLGDEGRATALTAAMAMPGGGRVGSQADRVAARAAMALDPPAPIRYKGRAVMPLGLATVLADAVLRDGSPQAIVEILTLQLPHLWVNFQTEFRPEFVPMVQNLDALRPLFERTTPGYGLERALYEANRALPCVSPAVRRDHPTTPIAVLAALDRVAGGRDRPSEPIDRHIAAFIAARHRRMDETLYHHLGSSADPARRLLAILTLYADVQTRSGNPALPGLARWLSGLLTPVINRFHHRPTRESVRKTLDQASQQGRLAEMLKIADDAEALRRDHDGFLAARRDWRALRKEIDRLKKVIADKNALIEGVGRPTAAVVAGIVATFLVSGIVIRHFVL